MNDEEDTAENTSRTKVKRRYYYQLGAPALVYPGSRKQAHFRVPTTTLSEDSARRLYEDWKSKNRVKARWNYSLDVDQMSAVSLSAYGDFGSRTDEVQEGRTLDGTRDDNRAVDENDSQQHDDENDDSNNNSSSPRLGGNENAHYGEHGKIDNKQQRDSLSMLLRDDPYSAKRHKQLLQGYADFEHPYLPGDTSYRDTKNHVRKGLTKEPRLRPIFFSKSQEFGINFQVNSDPSYLAPLTLDDIKNTLNEDNSNFRKRIGKGSIERLPQGNTLLAMPCPCRPCSMQQQRASSWVLFHPKGVLLERLCISNLVPPLGQCNAGCVVSNWERSSTLWSVFEQLPNEVDLEDTILEIRQCGVWDADNLECIFVVRTSTCICVLTILCKKPDFEAQGFSHSEAVCWGCYVIEEKERIDNRSLSRRIPSLRPISLTSHPRYGNAFAPARFAFASHSMGDQEIQNIVYSSMGETDQMMRHDISNLRTISLIDFDTNPMCLWSAASSYVRPALAPGVIAKMNRQARGLFGLGNSLYTIDLRCNDATFQWSPSAEEMMTEGVHSITGLLKDWDRDSTIWVTSNSAGKTWEIDGRMPSVAVNAWCLTSGCEGLHRVALAAKAFNGETSLLIKPLNCVDSARHSGDNEGYVNWIEPLAKVNTEFGASGFFIFQKPLSKPRFQTNNLEAPSIPGIDFSMNSSIATSSYFSLPEVHRDSHITGIASLRLSVDHFVKPEEKTFIKGFERDASILCILTSTSNGEIFCHNLLEVTSSNAVESVQFDGMPLGTSVVCIPPEVDGRTRLLDKGHWKPTGGMNLRLFLTNLYPLARNVNLAKETPARQRKNEVIIKNSKKKKIDENERYLKVANQRQCGVIISSDGTNSMLGREAALKIPISISRQCRKRMDLYTGEEMDLSDNEDENDSASENDGGKSDLPTSTIHNMLQAWDECMPDQETGSDE